MHWWLISFSLAYRMQLTSVFVIVVPRFDDSLLRFRQRFDYFRTVCMACREFILLTRFAQTVISKNSHANGGANYLELHRVISNSVDWWSSPIAKTFPTSNLWYSYRQFWWEIVVEKRKWIAVNCAIVNTFFSSMLFNPHKKAMLVVGVPPLC